MEAGPDPAASIFVSPGEPLLLLSHHQLKVQLVSSPASLIG